MHDVFYLFFFIFLGVKIMEAVNFFIKLGLMKLVYKGIIYRQGPEFETFQQLCTEGGILSV